MDMFTSKKRVEFAICVANEGHEDLELWKVYQVLPDAKAAGVGCIRVIDESGEDYLYPAHRFVAVDSPRTSWRGYRDGNQVTGLTRRCTGRAKRRRAGERPSR